MTATTRPRGTRIHVELDRELIEALDEVRKDVRLSRINFIRWMLARQLLGTHSLSAISAENAQ